MDGSSSSIGLGEGLIVVGLEGVITEYVLHSEFPVTDNEAEYKTMIAGLRVARELGM